MREAVIAQPAAPTVQSAQPMQAVRGGGIQHPMPHLLSFLGGILLLDFLYAPDLSIDKSYLDPMRVRNGIGQNILDDSLGQFSCSLVLLEDN